ncbi:hypothetical protein OOK31_34855 [Streptomyces sp. NBC_00249]|uniref:hypothetical protein n=1 Tax=Streptomyces sp. NBC_00249 TaxID=2975690 RepID=UPI00225BF14D|nr:hypothetical protein [Streptomyces sp. NBC_00249]MCX5199009.1 hypothetical protein [Streptomyces sp. NBC_00249]
MGAERAQGGRGWVRIPASRAEQSPARPPTAPGHGAGPFAPFGSGDPAAIYLSLLKRWREAGRTLPGHPDEEWERLISQPCWPGR